MATNSQYYGIGGFPGQTNPPTLPSHLPTSVSPQQYLKPYLTGAPYTGFVLTPNVVHGLTPTNAATTTYSTVTTAYHVSGNVTYLGSNVSGWLIWAFDEENNHMPLGSAVTNGSGNYSIPIIAYTGNVSVVAYPPTPGSPSVDAQIYANVVPA